MAGLRGRDRGAGRGGSSKVVAFGLSLLLLLAGCGGSDGDSDVADPGGPGGGEGSSDSTDDAPADGSVEGVLQQLADLPYAERQAALAECAAAEEGTVTLYGAASLDLLDAIAVEITATYPFLSYEHVSISSGELEPRVMAEYRADRLGADVIEIGSENAIQLNNEGVFANHLGVPLPDNMPAGAVEDWFVVNLVNPMLIFYNTDLVAPEDVPTGYDDLSTSRFANGRIALHPTASAWIQAMIVDRGEAAAREFFEGLVEEHEAGFRDGMSAIAAAVAAGEFDLGVVYADNAQRLIDEGAPVAWVAGDPIPGHGVGMGIASGTPRPCSAALVINFFTDPDQGGQLIADTGRLPTAPGTTMPNPDLQPFAEEGSDLQQRLLVLTPAFIEQSGAAAQDVLDTVFLPHFSG